MAENKLANLSMDFAVSILKVTDGIDQFRNMFPNSTVNIISGKRGFNNSARGTKTYDHRKEVE